MPSDNEREAAPEKIDVIATLPLVAGVAVASLVFLVSLTVCAYRCYQKRNERDAQTRLSNAIRKGLKETTPGSLKRSASLKSTASMKSVGSMKTRMSPTGGAPGQPGQKSDPNIPDRNVSGGGDPGHNPPLDASQIKIDKCYIENEKEGALSPCEENGNEKYEEDLKQPKLGSLYFSVEYDHQKTALLVTIIRASGLPVKDANVGSSDPYVKCQLLPEKKHKVKTRVLRKTLNPVYDETFTFYGISYNQLQGTTLHFVVLSFDRFSRDDIIGEVVHSLNGIDLSKQEVALCKEIAPRHMKMHCQGRGELLVSLCYQPAANRLTVVVLKARNLPKMDITGLSDPYVKIYLLYNGQRIAKKKTHVKKRTLNPVFNESFLFDVPCNEGLQNISLEFLILDWDRVTKNEVIGRLEIGARPNTPEQHHWHEVMNCPRKQIAEWHKLKE